MFISLRNIAFVAAAVVTAGSTIAATVSISPTDLSPLHAHTVNLEDYTAVVYYTENYNDSFQVITTVGPNVDINGQITRHKAVVRSGDNYVFSLDNGVPGSSATTIDITAEDGQLKVVTK
ncbi:MAG: hypothetical protein AB8B87_10240 [Granulosicoccus sp.]